MNTAPPRLKDLVMDRESGRVGVLMAYEAGTAWLRPASGGREWTTQVRSIRAVTPKERLRALVADANARSQGKL